MTAPISPVAASVEVDDHGRIVIMVDGRVSVFDITSEEMRRFSRELAEAALAKDLRA